MIETLKIDTPYTITEHADGSRTVQTPWHSYRIRAAAAPAPDLTTLTRAELYAIAQERNISGRGSMTKAQLIAALEATP